jgi:hypothetical protein
MKWFCLLFVGGLGLALFVGGIVSTARHVARLRAGVWTVGTVVELLETRSTGKGSGYAYYPVVQFVVNDRPYQIKGGTGSSSRRYEINAKVRIVYDSADPSRALILDFWQFPYVPIVGAFFGLALLYTGIGFFRAGGQ